MVDRADGAQLPAWVRHATAEIPDDARPGAVLMLLAEGDAGPDLLLTERAHTLRHHAGQPAFPGGAVDPGEADITAALREAQEETGLDPVSVVPVASLPRLYLRPSHFVVRPIVGYWRTPGPVRAVDPAETARVARVPVSALANPENRAVVQIPLPDSPTVLSAPAFTVDGLTVWGFTAGLVDLLLEWGGWAQPWDRSRVVDLPGFSTPTAVTGQETS